MLLGWLILALILQHRRRNIRPRAVVVGFARRRGNESWTREMGRQNVSWTSWECLCVRICPGLWECFSLGLCPGVWEICVCV